MLRVKAVYVEDCQTTDDLLVFDAFINLDDSLERMEMFGYIIDDNEKWPVSYRYHNGKGIIDWGAGEEDTISTINIFEKKIIIGEYFTRTDNIAGEIYQYTYRITDIFNWDSLK